LKKQTAAEEDNTVRLPECRFLNENGGCDRLSRPKCIGESCTALSASQNTESWKKRLSALSEEEQKKIAKKYYGGKRPWQKDNGGLL